MHGRPIGEGSDGQQPESFASVPDDDDRDARRDDQIAQTGWKFRQPCSMPLRFVYTA
jgi:hypothetical protein